MLKVVSIGESGKRVGEDHQHAVLSNEYVDLIRELHEDFEGWSYGKLAEVFGVSTGHIRDLCKYRRRVTMSTGSKVVHTAGDENSPL